LLNVAAVKLFTPPKRLIAIAKAPTTGRPRSQAGADSGREAADVYQRIRFATSARKLEA